MRVTIEIKVDGQLIADRELNLGDDVLTRVQVAYSYVEPGSETIYTSTIAPFDFVVQG